MSDLVKRLRSVTSHAASTKPMEAMMACQDAADRIEALERQVERRSALAGQQNERASALADKVASLSGRIEALEAENARLREALKPFAKSKQVFDKAEPCLPDGHAYNLTWNMDEGRCDFTLGQFRRARAAMEPTNE